MSTNPGVVQPGAGPSAPVVIRPLTEGPLPLLGLICTLTPGAVLTYTVQVTADPAPSPSGNWNNHDVLVGQTVSANGNIAYPVTGVRINVTAWTSGSVNLGIAQWP